MTKTKSDKRSDIEDSLGLRINQRRRQVRMTLDKLAEKTDLTASFISQVERGKANLSLHSLQAVAKALDVPVFYFVSTDTDSGVEEHSDKPKESDQKSAAALSFNPVVVSSNRSRLVLPNAGLDLELLVPNVGLKLISFKARLAPNTFHMANRLKQPTEEILYMLSGTLTLEFTDATYSVHPDDTIYFEGEKLLRMVNTSETEEAVWISVITPGIF